MDNEGYRSGFVAIIGRPNVGKSTLLNQIMGQKLAIMSDKPQTTRNQIRCIYTTDKAQIIFIDTPGIHKPKHKLGEILVHLSEKTLEEVDIILYVVEANSEFGGGEHYITERLKEVKTPVFLIINKIDTIPKEQLLPLIEKYKNKMDFKEVIPISALENNNVDRMLSILSDYLPEGPKYYPEDMITEQPERFIVAELIREKVLLLTRDEVPHAIAVEVEELQKRKNNLVYIRAVIYTERESQKGIIVGKSGLMLKKVGELARQEIENLLDTKIYLDLWVKVKKDWRNKDSFLKGFGYTRER